MNTRTNIVLDDDLIAQAMLRANVTTKKAAVQAALKAYVRKPDYPGLLALRGKGMIVPDYDPRGPCGLTQVALQRRGRTPLEDARPTPAAQADSTRKPARKSAKPGGSMKLPSSRKRVLGASGAGRTRVVVDAA